MTNLFNNSLTFPGFESSWTARDLADLWSGRVVGDEERRICDVNDPYEAGEDECIILFSRDTPGDTQAGVIVVPESFQSFDTSHTWIVVPDPMAVMEWFHRAWFSTPDSWIFPGKNPDETACMFPDVTFGPNVILSGGVKIGSGSLIGPHVVLMGPLRIGRYCRIEAGTVLYPRIWLGDRVVIGANAVLGSEGFRYIPYGEGLRRIPHIGRVVIEDDVEIGAGTCIDRAVTGTTRIRAGTKIDNLVQVAHNVKIGRRCLLAAQVGVAGSSVVGDGVMIGGQAGIADHAIIGDGVKIAAQSGVMGKVKAFTTVAGTPAMNHQNWLRLQVILNHLPSWLKEWNPWKSHTQKPNTQTEPE